MSKSVFHSKNSILVLNIFTIVVVILGVVFLSSAFYSRKNQIQEVDVSNGNSAIENATSTLPTTALKPSFDPLSENSVTTKPCDGTWLELKSTEKINLSYVNLYDWGPNTSPSVINETKNSENIVAIGHNWCPYGNCFAAGSQFSQIINSKIGDEANLCMNNVLYSGFVVISEAIPETKTEVLSNWLNIPSVTLFTSYGNCKTSECNVTDQRWLVVFSRN